MPKERRITKKGLRLLSFDGGGLRALSQALIIREMLRRIRYDAGLREPPKVADYFDVICGSGFGGLLAIMSGILCMTGEELVDEFVALCHAVFADNIETSERTQLLEFEIRRMIGKFSNDLCGDERRMISHAGPCHVFVCAVPQDNMAHPRIFRNYVVRSNASPDCFVWQAARATLSIPDLLNQSQLRFIGGELRWNNPTHELTVEIATLFEDHDVACVVSIGSGHPKILALRETLPDVFRQITEDCQHRHNEMSYRFERVEQVYWRFSVDHGMEDVAASNIGHFTNTISSTFTYLQMSQSSRDVDALLLILRDPPPTIPVNSISGQAAARARSIHLRECPQPTLYFTGRTSILKAMRTYFLNRKYRFHICVLYGIGGGGKTQSALMFVQQSIYENIFTEVFFLDASDKLALENGFKAIAMAHGTGESFEDGIRYLKGRKDAWILLFDNADDPDFDLGPYLRWSHGNILITTRSRQARTLAPDCNLHIDRLELHEAQELLLRGVEVPTGINGDQLSNEIVEELGYLALAINQARAFLANGICSISQYLTLYRENRKKMLHSRPSQSTDDYENTVYTTWLISYNRLSDLAQIFVQLLSFMHYEGIPSIIFRHAWEHFSELDSDEQEETIPNQLTDFLSNLSRDGSGWDEAAFLELLHEVLSFSLCNFDSSNQLLSLHPLVQLWAQDFFQCSETILCATQTVLALATPDGEESVDSAGRRMLALHFRECLKHGIYLHHTYGWEAGETLREGGLVRDAEGVFERELREKRNVHGPESLNTLKAMHSLAVTYSDLGQHQDALKLKEEVLEQRKRILGPDHPGTLEAMHNLAVTYSDLGRHHHALKLYEEVLELRKRILGPDHPDTLHTMHGLGVTYTGLGQHRDALKLEEEVLELRKRILGPDHPDTLYTMFNLAITYSQLGQLRDALKLEEKVLDLMKRIGPSSHAEHIRQSCHNKVSTSSQTRRNSCKAEENFSFGQ
ncbi:hypothetical protein DL96DRAFT_1581063 [Flagelloscypha sp. PMI_526]|nr:hypothetical protein DL96DRAFT_1581063 [Flagelloscypha sp. PMI_526]